MQEPVVCHTAPFTLRSKKFDNAVLETYIAFSREADAEQPWATNMMVFFDVEGTEYSTGIEALDAPRRLACADWLNSINVQAGTVIDAPHELISISQHLIDTFPLGEPLPEGEVSPVVKKLELIAKIVRLTAERDACLRLIAQVDTDKKPTA